MDINKEFKQVVPAMIKPVLHFFKIHGKVVFGNPSVVVQDMLGKTPESLNAVDVILGTPIDQNLTVVNGVVLAQTLERIIAPEGVGVVDRPFPSLLPDDSHQFFFGDMFHYSRINLAIALQKAKNNVFTTCTPTTLALASATEITLVHLYFTIELATFKFCYMVDSFTQALIEAGNGLIIKPQIMRQAISRLLLIETLNDGNLGTNLLQGLLFSTGLVSASHIPSGSFYHLERTAENTLLTPQKVGHAPENVLSSLCHMDILVPYGYETH